LVGGLFNIILLFYLGIKSGIKFNIKADTRNAFSLLRESFPIAAASILAHVIVVLLPVIYLGIVTSNAEVGIFSAAYRIVVVLLIFDRVFNTLFFPKIVGQIDNPSQNVEDTFRITFKIISAFAFAISMLAVISGDLLVKVIFTTEYIEAIPVFRVLTGYFIFTLMNSVFGFTLIGMKKAKYYTWSMIIGGIVFVISGIIFTSLYKSVGMVISLVLFEIITLISMNILIEKRFRINLFRYVLIPLFIAFSCSVLLLYYINLPLVLELLITVVICVPVVSLSLGVGTKEIDFIKRILI